MIRTETIGGWRRRNRWAAVGLPLALLAALGASSDRVGDYFWTTDLRQAQHADAGEWLDFSGTYADADGRHPLDVRLKIESVRPSTTAWGATEPLDLPDGSVALTVTLRVEADPGLPLSGCTLALRGDDGTKYGYLPYFADAFQPGSACVPPDTPGPLPSLGDADDHLSDDSVARPASWTVEPVVVVPRGTRITDVLIWWQTPAYASLAVD